MKGRLSLCLGRSVIRWSQRKPSFITSRRSISQNNNSKSSRSHIAGGDVLILLGVPLGLSGVLGEAYFRSDLQDSQTPQECSFEATNALIQDHHVRRLEQEGLVVIPNALDASALKAARQDLMRFVSSTSKLDLTTNDADVRQDRIAWVRANGKNNEEDEASETTLGSNMEDCIQLIRGVTHTLLKHNYSGSGANDQPRHFRIPQRCQLALYPGDGVSVYHRHLDQCQNSIWELGLLEWLRLSDYRSRSVTVILYLNEADRPKSDGGALRCWVAKPQPQGNSIDGDSHKENDNKDAAFYPPVDVQPTGGTMVIFESGRVEHMVLSSTADRYAITSWVVQL